MVVVLFDVQIVVFFFVYTPPRTLHLAGSCSCPLAGSVSESSPMASINASLLRATETFGNLLFRTGTVLSKAFRPSSTPYLLSRCSSRVQAHCWAPSRPLILLMLSSDPMADLLLSASRVHNSTLLTLPPDFKNWFPTCPCHPNIVLHPNRLHGLDHRTSVAPSRV